MLLPLSFRAPPSPFRTVTGVEYPPLVEAPAWLTEAMIACFAWEKVDPSPTPWSSWLHQVWHEAPDIPYQSVLSEVTERPLYVTRSAPSASEVSDLFTRERPVPGSAALVLLQHRRLVHSGSPPLPLLLPPVSSSPELFTREFPYPPVPLVAAFGCSGLRQHAALGRPLDPLEANLAGIFPPGAPLEHVVVNLLERGALGCHSRLEVPFPWLSQALTGQSGVKVEDLPADPALPLLSLWLLRLCVAVREDQGWSEAVASLPYYASFTTWESVRRDQRLSRSLGEWVHKETAEVLDTALTALLFLDKVPAPVLPMAELAVGTSVSMRQQIGEVLTGYPQLAYWFRRSS